jgi:hypothetical protein
MRVTSSRGARRCEEEEETSSEDDHDRFLGKKGAVLRVGISKRRTEGRLSRVGTSLENPLERVFSREKKIAERKTSATKKTAPKKGNDRFWRK